MAASSLQYHQSKNNPFEYDGAMQVYRTYPEWQSAKTSRQFVREIVRAGLMQDAQGEDA